MIDLQQRLSEFSYGYGVTREVETLLYLSGLSAVPFLPNLQHEAVLGFDAGFDLPGTALLLQFKLGYVLKRYFNKGYGNLPGLNRPFFRFSVDTSGGQFKALAMFEKLGAISLYAAPRFSTWQGFKDAFTTFNVLNRSLVLRPSEIRKKMNQQHATAGWHDINYDLCSAYLCSEPIELEKVAPDEIVNYAKMGFAHDERLSLLVRRLSAAWERLRKPRGRPSKSHDRLRRDRLSFLRLRSNSEDHALAALLGEDLWAQGIQIVFVAHRD